MPLFFTSNSNGYSCLQLHNLYSLQSYVRNLGSFPGDSEQKHERLTQPLRHDSSGKDCQVLLNTTQKEKKKSAAMIVWRDDVRLSFGMNRESCFWPAMTWNSNSASLDQDTFLLLSALIVQHHNTHLYRGPLFTAVWCKTSGKAYIKKESKWRFAAFPGVIWWNEFGGAADM